MTTTENAIHCFERAGLGKAPFTLVNIVEKIASGMPDENGMIVGSPGQPMGTCKFCYTGIAECYEILSADGNRFDVGCECVRKTGDAGLMKKVNKHKNQKRKAREAQRIAAAIEILEADKDLMTHKPHPKEWQAKKGLTLRDWAEWMFANGGNAGKMKVVRLMAKGLGRKI